MTYEPRLIELKDAIYDLSMGAMSRRSNWDDIGCSSAWLDFEFNKLRWPTTTIELIERLIGPFTAESRSRKFVRDLGRLFPPRNVADKVLYLHGMTPRKRVLIEFVLKALRPYSVTVIENYQRQEQLVGLVEKDIVILNDFVFEAVDKSDLAPLFGGTVVEENNQETFLPKEDLNVMQTIILANSESYPSAALNNRLSPYFFNQEVSLLFF